MKSLGKCLRMSIFDRFRFILQNLMTKQYENQVQSLFTSGSHLTGRFQQYHIVIFPSILQIRTGNYWHSRETWHFPTKCMIIFFLLQTFEVNTRPWEYETLTRPAAAVSHSSLVWPSVCPEVKRCRTSGQQVVKLLFNDQGIGFIWSKHARPKQLEQKLQNISGR